MTPTDTLTVAIALAVIAVLLMIAGAYQIGVWHGREEVETSEHLDPDGEIVWYATDHGTPDVYGEGSTEAEAIENLERAQEFWKRAMQSKTVADGPAYREAS